MVYTCSFFLCVSVGKRWEQRRNVTCTVKPRATCTDSWPTMVSQGANSGSSGCFDLGNANSTTIWYCSMYMYVQCIYRIYIDIYIYTGVICECDIVCLFMYCTHGFHFSLANVFFTEVQKPACLGTIQVTAATSVSMARTHGMLLHAVCWHGNLDNKLINIHQPLSDTISQYFQKPSLTHNRSARLKTLLWWFHEWDILLYSHTAAPCCRSGPLQEQLLHLQRVHSVSMHKPQESRHERGQSPNRSKKFHVRLGLSNRHFTNNKSS